MKILFICTGNTCRSPMAEALVKHKMPGAKVQSAGIYAGENEQANPNAKIALQDINISLQHRSQPVTNDLLNWADLILTMTTGHKQSLSVQYPDYQDKYFTLKEYVLGANLTNNDISDPFGGALAIYRETLKELDQYVDLLKIKTDK